MSMGKENTWEKNIYFGGRGSRRLLFRPSAAKQRFGPDHAFITVRKQSTLEVLHWNLLGAELQFPWQFPAFHLKRSIKSSPTQE